MTKRIEKQINQKLTKKDYLLYLINRNTFILISPIIIVSLITVFIFMIDKDGFQFEDIIYLLPILLFIFSYIQMNNAINKAIKSNKDTKDLRVILEEKRYKEITSNGENALEYDKFHTYYESKNYFYLYVDKVNALIIPKREFNNDELTTINGYFQKYIRKTPLFNSKNILGCIFSLALIISVVILIASMI